MDVEINIEDMSCLMPGGSSSNNIQLKEIEIAVEKEKWTIHLFYDKFFPILQNKLIPEKVR